MSKCTLIEEIDVCEANTKGFANCAPLQAGLPNVFAFLLHLTMFIINEIIHNIIMHNVTTF